MSRKRTIDSSRSCEGRRLGKTFFSTISSSDQICQYLMPHTSSITYLITFLTSIFLHIEAGRTRFSAEKRPLMKEAKRWHWDAADANQVRYILMVIILNSFIRLFVPFTALCLNENPISFDIATSQKRCNVKWNRILIWTQSSKWDK